MRDFSIPMDDTRTLKAEAKMLDDIDRIVRKAQRKHGRSIGRITAKKALKALNKFYRWQTYD